MKKNSLFLEKFEAASTYLFCHLRQLQKNGDSVNRIDFKVSHDLSKTLSTVSSQSLSCLYDKSEVDLFINCISSEVARYECRNEVMLICFYSKRTKVLSINLIVYV